VWLVVFAVASIGGAADPVDFPGPLEGPGQPQLKRSETKRLAKAWGKLAAGDTSGASKAVRKVRENPAGELLVLQIRMVGDDDAPVEALGELCAKHPGYAAAWATLTTARERAGDETGALEAAGRVATLWPESPWAASAGELWRRWVDDRLAAALARLVAGEAEEALELVAQVTALDEGNREGVMVKALALIELDRDQEAAEVLSAIADNPEARIMLAQMAEDRGDLVAAMQYYSDLPEGMPGRDEWLERVKLVWRIRNLPNYVQDALASEELNRAELAVIRVGLMPEAHAVGGGQVPVLSDIVDLPSQREILTAVRLDLMEVDRIQHQFNPEHIVTPAEARVAIDGLSKLLNLDLPIWCTDNDEPGSSCVMLDIPIRGEAVADVILSTTHGENS